MKLQDQHQFLLKGSDWFWMAGIVKDDYCAMLTFAIPVPTSLPYHRQIVVLPPNQGMECLSDPSENILPYVLEECCNTGYRARTA